MSFRPFFPGHFGIVIAHDPTTRALGAMWAADEVLGDVSTSHPAEVPQHPVETGGAALTDVVLRGPSEMRVSFLLSNAQTPGHPAPTYAPPDRALKLRDAFLELADRASTVAVLVRGHGLLFYRAIGTVDERIAGDSESIILDVTFTPLRLESLQAVPVSQDADLLALGSQIVAGGTL